MSAWAKQRDRLNELAEQLEDGGAIDPFDLRILARQADAQDEMLREGLAE